jgi:hypothetical protein
MAAAQASEGPGMMPCVRRLRLRRPLRCGRARVRRAPLAGDPREASLDGTLSSRSTSKEPDPAPRGPTGVLSACSKGLGRRYKYRADVGNCEDIK